MFFLLLFQTLLIGWYVIVLYSFSGSGRSFAELGFGSVFDGGANFGVIGNMSTQAVIELIKNVSEEQESGVHHIEISPEEVEQFYVPGIEETGVQDTSNAGNFILWK